MNSLSYILPEIGQEERVDERLLMRNSVPSLARWEFLERGLLGNKVAKRDRIVIGAGLHHQRAPAAGRLFELKIGYAHRTGFARQELIGLILGTGGGVHDPHVHSERHLVLELETKLRRFDQWFALKGHLVDELTNAGGGSGLGAASRPWTGWEGERVRKVMARRPSGELSKAAADCPNDVAGKMSTKTAKRKPMSLVPPLLKTRHQFVTKNGIHGCRRGKARGLVNQAWHGIVG